MENNPWRTIILQGMELDVYPWTETTDFAFGYIFKKTSIILPAISIDNSLDHNFDLIPVSSAF